MSCSNNDDEKPEGLQTSAWGPVGWQFLHCITFGYPYKINPMNIEHNNKASDYAKFFYYLGKVLPCKYCRSSYNTFIEENPINNHLKTRYDLCKWLYNIHNLVNAKLNCSNNISFEDVQKKYEQFRAKCGEDVEKGCVLPSNGKRKVKSIIKVVDYDNDNYIVVSKYNLAIFVLIMVFAICVLFGMK